MLNGLDLFSGIGGLTLALAGVARPVAYCENDRYAQSVLLSRMRDGGIPIAPIWDNIESLQGCVLPSNIDVIWGGFPCQDISVAGHGVGLAGKRSGLVSEFYRLIDEIRPNFVFMENVPAIRTRGAHILSGELACRRYDQRWLPLSAESVGGSFLGIRWFLFAAADSETLRKQQRGWGWTSGPPKTFDLAARYAGLAPRSPERGFESRVFGTGDGIPFAVDRDRVLGNAVVSAQAREAFQRLIGLK